MPLEQWSDNVLLVRLADEPQFSDDLDALVQHAARGRNVVLDFTAVQYVNSSNLSRLIQVRQEMIRSDSRLILCNISTQVWGVFLVTGLDKVFQFSDDVTTALTTLQIA